MRPTRLRLDGFTCFKDPIDLDLEGLDLFVVCGPTGAGKSSLLDAMLFALYGEVPRTGKQGVRDLISLGRERVYVSLDFRVGTECYRVMRTRRVGGTTQAQLERLENGAAVPIAGQIRSVDSEIRRLLGMSFEAFTQAAILPQGLFAEFLHSEPSKRRALLNEILRLQVYERMRERAEAVQREHAHEVKALERQLADDFQEVSEESLKAAEERALELEIQLTPARARAAELEVVRGDVRRNWEKTRELAEKEKELKETGARRADMDLVKKRLEAARRAARIVPVLEQARRAEQEAARRAAEARLAQAEFTRHEAQHQQAQAALEEAQRAAEATPALRQRVVELATAAAQKEQTDRLRRECQTVEQQLQERQRLHDQALEKRLAFEKEIAALDRKLKRAREELAGLRYDPVEHQTLESLREPALVLRNGRQQLLDVHALSERLGQAAASAATLAEEARRRQQRVLRVRDTAAADVQEIDRNIQRLRDAHAAAHLRAGLKVGEPCPVCFVPVVNLPDALPVPQVRETEEEKRRAVEGLQAAQAEVERANMEVAGAEAHAAAARSQAEEARARLEQAKQQVADAEAVLEGRMKEVVRALAASDFPLFETPTEPVESVLLARLADAAAARERFDEAAHAEKDLKHRRELKAQALASVLAELQGHEQQLEQLTQTLRMRQAELETTTQTLHALVGDLDPAAEKRRLEEQIETLESRHAAAARCAAEERPLLTAAQARAAELHKQAAEAAAHAQATAHEAQTQLVAAGFCDAAAVQRAALDLTEIERLEADLEKYERTLHALEARCGELDQALQGQRIGDADLERAEQAYREASAAIKSLEAEQVALQEKLRGLRARLARADRLRAELAEKRQRHSVYARLAEDLRSDHFQEFLLEETLGALVRGAAVQLGRLTQERFGLDYQDGRIVVIDHDNADQCRPAETLSGGETFLTALALALELSEQVQRIAGAVHTDSLFIDEGFGTLDPDTLNLVADAVRGLQVGGRMIGIITHVPELKEQFEQRITISREAGCARVQVDR